MVNQEEPEHAQGAPEEDFGQDILSAPFSQGLPQEHFQKPEFIQIFFFK